MADIEQIEIARVHQEIVEDLRHMLRKYERIMGWNVPDLDVQAARQGLLGAMRAALAEVEGESRG